MIRSGAGASWMVQWQVVKMWENLTIDAFLYVMGLWLLFLFEVGGVVKARLCEG